MSRPGDAPPEPRDREEAFRRMESLLAVGDAQAAFELAMVLLGEGEAHADTLLRACRAFAASGMSAHALELAGRIARLAPDAARARGIHAVCLWAAGQRREALAQAREALALDPRDMDSLRLLLAASPQDTPEEDLDGMARELLLRTDNPQDFALVLQHLAARRRGRPFGVVHLRDGLLTGAAFSPCRPEAHLEVELCLEGARLAAFPADRAHPALAAAGLPDGHAFALRLPAGLHGLALTARLAATGEECLGSPLEPQETRRERRGVEGSVRATPADCVRGFAWRPDAPGERLGVVLEGGAGRRVRAVASRFEPRLLAQGVHDGAHGFLVRWELPPGHACEAVHVREAATGQPLRGSPVLVCDPDAAARALREFNGWLLAVQASPHAPPPLPESCGGPLLRMIRQRNGAWMHALAGKTSRDDAEGDGD